MANAMDVYPPRDLPGRADDWGRRVEAVSEDLYKSQVQLQQTLNNGQRATAGQLALLSRQLKMVTENQVDLLGRVSHQRIADKSPSSLGSFPVGGTVIPGTNFSFTLGESRQVQITQFAMVSTTSNPMRVGINLSGTNRFNTSESSTTYIGDYGAPQTGAVHFSGLFTLPAGTHSVSSAGQVSGSGTPVCTVYTAYTVVNVLQKTV